MPDTSKLEKLNRELEKSEKKLRKAINDEKVLQHQLKQLTRKPFIKKEERLYPSICTVFDGKAVSLTKRWKRCKKHHMPPTQRILFFLVGCHSALCIFSIFSSN